MCTEFCYSKPTGKWIVHYQIFCYVGHGSTFQHKFIIKIPFSVQKNISDNNNSWYCTIDVYFMQQFIFDQLLTLNKEVCHENWKCIYRIKCHLTLTNNLDLHNFLITIESESLSYWIQHTKLYIWGKYHALIIFWKLPLILAAKQLDYKWYSSNTDRRMLTHLPWTKWPPF